MTFDPLSSTYDSHFTHTIIGQTLRKRSHDRLAIHFSAGDAVLELGCGTGEDACWLAEQGVHVTATDASPQMLAITQEKTQHLPHVQTQLLDLDALPAAIPGAYDGVVSNFGALNCLQEWRTLAGWLAQCVKPGGVVCLGVMAPFCLWELLWHSAHLDFAVALRRLRGSSFQPSPDVPAIPITYPTVRRLTRDFAPHFERTKVQPLGLFLPPSDVFGVIEKRPRLLRRLQQLEAHTGHIAQLALFADHYWVEFVTAPQN